MKNAHLILGVAVAILAILGTAWKSAADYGALEQRVTAAEQRQTRSEADREKDRAELLTIRLLVTRICAVTPGCRE